MLIPFNFLGLVVIILYDPLLIFESNSKASQAMIVLKISNYHTNEGFRHSTGLC